MNRFDGLLICTDLDGTLYKGDKTISKENREAIDYFKSEGGLFTFITGRMPYYSMDAYRNAAPNVPFGCVNGGGLYDGEKMEYIWKTPMPCQVFELVKHVEEHFSNIGIQVSCFDKTHFVKENSAMARFRRLTGVPNLACRIEDVKDPIAKIIFGSESEAELLGIEKLLRAHPSASKFDFIRSERTLFEIVPKGVDKGLALVKLTEYLGTDINKTVAVGDYNNDIGMLKAARLGIAVANACKEALAAADCITVSNEDHAIARTIYDIEHGRYTF